jgi:hypothetical protein
MTWQPDRDAQSLAHEALASRFGLIPDTMSLIEPTQL